MVQYEDTSADESVRIYDRGLDMRRGAGHLRRVPADLPQRRHRDPRAAAEPLRLELQDFANSIRTGAWPRSNVELGLEIVAAMESAETSMRERGAPRRVMRYPPGRVASAGLGARRSA